MGKETKKCPYCGEEIMAVAKKCRYCGEWLEEQHIVEQTGVVVNEPAVTISTTLSVKTWKISVLLLFMVATLWDLLADDILGLGALTTGQELDLVIGRGVSLVLLAYPLVMIVKGIKSKSEPSLKQWLACSGAALGLFFFNRLGNLFYALYFFRNNGFSTYSSDKTFYFLALLICVAIGIILWIKLKRLNTLKQLVTALTWEVVIVSILWIISVIIQKAYIVSVNDYLNMYY